MIAWTISGLSGWRLSPVLLFFHFPLHRRLPVFLCWRKCQQLHWRRQTNFSLLSSTHDVVCTRTPQILPQVLSSIIKNKNSDKHQLCCYNNCFSLLSPEGAITAKEIKKRKNSKLKTLLKSCHMYLSWLFNGRPDLVWKVRILQLKQVIQ